MLVLSQFPLRLPGYLRFPISKSKMGGCGTNSQLGMKRETPTLTFKLKLKIYILMKLVVKAGSRDCESSLKAFYTHDAL